MLDLFVLLLAVIAIVVGMRGTYTQTLNNLFGLHLSPPQGAASTAAHVVLTGNGQIVTTASGQQVIIGGTATQGQTVQAAPGSQTVQWKCDPNGQNCQRYVCDSKGMNCVLG